MSLAIGMGTMQYKSLADQGFWQPSENIRAGLTNAMNAWGNLRKGGAWDQQTANTTKSQTEAAAPFSTPDYAVQPGVSPGDATGTTPAASAPTGPPAAGQNDQRTADRVVGRVFALPGKMGAIDTTDNGSHPGIPRQETPYQGSPLFKNPATGQPYQWANAHVEPWMTISPNRALQVYGGANTHEALRRAAAAGGEYMQGPNGARWTPYGDVGPNDKTGPEMTPAAYHALGSTPGQGHTMLGQTPGVSRVMEGGYRPGTQPGIPTPGALAGGGRYDPMAGVLPTVANNDIAVTKPGQQGGGAAVTGAPAGGGGTSSGAGTGADASSTANAPAPGVPGLDAGGAIGTSSGASASASLPFVGVTQPPVEPPVMSAGRRQTPLPYSVIAANEQLNALRYHASQVAGMPYNPTAPPGTNPQISTLDRNRADAIAAGGAPMPTPSAPGSQLASATLPDPIEPPIVPPAPAPAAASGNAFGGGAPLRPAQGNAPDSGTEQPVDEPPIGDGTVMPGAGSRNAQPPPAGQQPPPATPQQAAQATGVSPVQFFDQKTAPEQAAIVAAGKKSVYDKTFAATGSKQIATIAAALLTPQKAAAGWDSIVASANNTQRLPNILNADGTRATPTQGEATGPTGAKGQVIDIPGFLRAHPELEYKRAELMQSQQKAADADMTNMLSTNPAAAAFIGDRTRPGAFEIQKQLTAIMEGNGRFYDPEGKTPLTDKQLAKLNPQERASLVFKYEKGVNDPGAIVRPEMFHTIASRAKLWDTMVQKYGEKTLTGNEIPLSVVRDLENTIRVQTQHARDNFLKELPRIDAIHRQKWNQFGDFGGIDKTGTIPQDIIADLRKGPSAGSTSTPAPYPRAAGTRGQAAAGSPDLADAAKHAMFQSNAEVNSAIVKKQIKYGDTVMLNGSPVVINKPSAPK